MKIVISETNNINAKYSKRIYCIFFFYIYTLHKNNVHQVKYSISYLHFYNFRLIDLKKKLP